MLPKELHIKLLSALGGILLLTSLWVLQLERLEMYSIPLAAAAGFGLLLGLAADVFTLAVVILVRSLLQRRWPKLALAFWVLAALTVVGTAVGDSLYIKFFGERMHLWILTQHLGDLFVVGGSASSLGDSWRLILCGLLLLLAIVAEVAVYYLRRGQPSGHSRRYYQVLAVSVVLGAILLAPLPFTRLAYLGTLKSSVLAEPILDVWLKELVGADRDVLNCARSTQLNLRTVREELKELDPAQSLQTLVQLRDYQRHHPVAAAPDAQWPLWRPLQTPDQVTANLRGQLGFADSGKLNVVVLFIESARAMELLHQELGPILYPRLRQRLAHQALWFPQAYSPCVEAGLTVRGEFATLCSMLPNIGGPAPAIAYPGIRITCLATLFKEAGYRTTWFNAHNKSYHNKDAFESLHGTDEFYDERYFAAQGITERIGWGLADGPVLQQTLQKLLEIHGGGEHFFAHVTTLSSHHPFRPTAKGKLPEDLVQRAKHKRSHSGYLSRIRYVDDAVGDFLDKLFASPLGDNTLVVVLGDHSITTKPFFEIPMLTRHQNRFRVPLAFLAKNVPLAKRYDWFAHQIDVAPTIAEVVGLGGRVSWLGRNVLREPGSPFVFLSSTGLHYRTAKRLCHTYRGMPELKCWDTQGRDPLFDDMGETVVADPDQSAFFSAVIGAARQAIVLNRLLPP